MLKVRFLFCVLVVGLLASCGNDDNASDNFDRTALLTNIGEQVIIPAYNDFSESAIALNNAVVNFSNNQSGVNFSIVRTQFIDTYTKWQHCNMFEFGPAFTNALKVTSNSFPTDVLTIEQNITSQQYDLKSATNLVASGLPAIDYLLFGDCFNCSDFIIDNNNALNYLKDLTTELAEGAEKVSNQWNNEYITTFISASGTDVGSSLGQLVNDLTKHIEKDVRDGKIGIPLGIRSLNEPLPMNVEAAYLGNYSIKLCKENLKAIKTLVNGDLGIGIDDYLNALNVQHTNESLAAAVNTAIDNSINKLNVIPVSLKEAVISHPTEVAEAYAALQELTVILKNDLTSALGILVTYQDNDGD